MTQTQIFFAIRSQKVAYSIATFGNSMLGAIITVFTYFYYKNVVYPLNFYEANELTISALLGFALAVGWWTQAVMNPVAG